MFALKSGFEVLWEELPIQKAPQDLKDAIHRIRAITSESDQANEAYSRTIIDQVLISAIYEENYGQPRRKEASPEAEQPAVLELQHETPLHQEVLFKGEKRMLTGYADYTVWYESRQKSSLGTNLVMIEAKEPNATDTCLGQLAAYMGVIHSVRKEEKKKSAVVYGVASDGLSYRFCRIDNEGAWSVSRLMEWELHDEDKIYSIFRSLIRIAALLSPTTSSIKNPQKRETVLASFGCPATARNFDVQS